MSWEPVRLSAVPSTSWEAGARPALGQSRRARAGQSSWGEVAGVCACTHACKIRWFVPAGYLALAATAGQWLVPC